MNTSSKIALGYLAYKAYKKNSKSKELEGTKHNAEISLIETDEDTKNIASKSDCNNTSETGDKLLKYAVGIVVIYLLYIYLQSPAAAWIFKLLAGIAMLVMLRYLPQIILLAVLYGLFQLIV